MRAFPPLGSIGVASAMTSLSLVLALTGIATLQTPVLATTAVLGALCIGLDALDGPVARRRNEASAFGAQLDSLVDAGAFGLLPALVLWPFGWQGVVAAIVWALCVVWRLADFGSAPMLVRDGRSYFRGMSSALSATLFWEACALTRLSDATTGWLPWLALAYAPCMIAGFAIPKGGWHERVHWVLLPATILAFGLVRGW